MNPGPAISGVEQRSVTSSRATISAAISRGGRFSSLPSGHRQVGLVVAELGVLALLDHVQQDADAIRIRDQAIQRAAESLAKFQQYAHSDRVCRGSNGTRFA